MYLKASLFLTFFSRAANSTIANIITNKIASKIKISESLLPIQTPNPDKIEKIGKKYCDFFRSLKVFIEYKEPKAIGMPIDGNKKHRIKAKIEMYLISFISFIDFTSLNSNKFI